MTNGRGDMRMLLGFLCVCVLMLVMLILRPAHAGDIIQSCTQADGSVVYTNKDVKGCSVVRLPELSVVPTRPATLFVERLVQDPIYAPTTEQGNRVITASPMVCELYQDWLQLQARTSGGFHNNTVDDTQKRLMYTTIFGSGYPPTGC